MFADHLRHAIRVNRRRGLAYAVRTRGRSIPLSLLLVASELASLPVATWLDHRARGFNARGIPIVKADFVSMADVGETGASPSRSGTTPRGARVRVRGELRRFGMFARRGAHRGDLDAVADACAALLERLSEVEEQHDAHLGMARHLVESIGLAAVNGRRWRRLSSGGTQRLTADLIRVQTLALSIDRRAQRLHAMGVGMVVNDVPRIPFPPTDPRPTSAAVSLGVASDTTAQYPA